MVLPNTIQFSVHVFDSKNLIIKFTDLMGSNALSVESYDLLLVSVDGYTPAFASAKYGKDQSEVILSLHESLTFDKVYTLSAVQIINVSATAVSDMSYNFTATVLDPPRAIGAFMSDINTVDVIFDRPVAPYNENLSGTLNGSDGSNIVTQVAWNSGDYPVNNIRFEITGTAATSPYTIEPDTVFDISLNGAYGVEIPVSTAFRAPEPVTGPTGFGNLQITHSSLCRVSSSSFLNVIFNAPVYESDVLDDSKWSINKPGSHVLFDSINSMPTGTPGDVLDLITKLSTMKLAYNSHLSIEGVHPFQYSPSSSELIKSVNSLLLSFQAHIQRDDIHGISSTDPIIYQSQARTLDSAIQLLNLMKDAFNSHLTESSVHSIDDTFFSVISIDATDANSAGNLSDDLRIKMTMHMMSSYGFHISEDILNSPPQDFLLHQCVYETPVDLLSCAGLATELQAKYLKHVSSIPVHLYSDDINTFQTEDVTDITFSEYTSDDISRISSLSQTIASSFNGHVLEDYPIDIINIRNFASNSSDVVDPYTYSVELEIGSNSYSSDVSIEATLRSNADLLIETDPIDYTGSIISKSLSSHREILYTSVLPDGSVSFRFDGGVSLLPIEEYVISSVDSMKPMVISVVTSPSVFSMTSFLVEMMDKYSVHIQNSGHITADVSNILSGSDYPVGGLSSLLNKLNNFKSVVNSHIIDTDYHHQLITAPISEPDATDIQSASVLLESIKKNLEMHNQDLFLHTSFEPLSIISQLFDTVTLYTSGLKDGGNYTAHVPVVHTFIKDGGSLATSMNNFDVSFTGISSQPVLSGVYVKPGLLGQSFRSDTLDFFFSHPMRTSDVLPSQISISGSVIVDKPVWLDDRRLSVRIRGMNATSYTASIDGLYDVSGNPIDPDPEVP